MVANIENTIYNAHELTVSVSNSDGCLSVIYPNSLGGG